MRLIEEYKKNEVLWNPKYPTLCLKKEKKTEAWEFISKVMNKDFIEIKKKMIDLRKRFRREQSKLRNTTKGIHSNIHTFY